MPTPTTEQMTEHLQALSAGLRDAFARLELLDETGRVPSSPLFGTLIRHVAAAQDLSRTAVHLATVIGIADQSSLLAHETDGKVREQMAAAATHDCSAAQLLSAKIVSLAGHVSLPGDRGGSVCLVHRTHTVALSACGRVTGVTFPAVLCGRPGRR
ncbi:hypothetical protein [Streptomyces sp. NPDC014894]|uniref:hypothetical protein n=1 Tax=Streptomyces sp. NPDC014894 TaxID=3364931 RepID=UPI0036F8B552